MEVASAGSGKGGRLMIPVVLPALKQSSQQRVDDDYREMNGADTSSIPLPYSYHWLASTYLTRPNYVAAPLQPRRCHSNLSNQFCTRRNARPAAIGKMQ